MQTDVAFDMMEKLLPHLSAVINDADVGETMKEIRKKQGGQQSGDMMAALLPLFIGKHREAMFNIVAVLEGKTVDEVRCQEFSQTIAAMRRNFVDDMLVFFHYCLRMARAA